MGRTLAASTKRKRRQQDDTETLTHAFFRGFLWPARLLVRSLAWLSHQFPLRHVGHGLRWFFRLAPLRFIGKVLGVYYIAASWQELRHVTWPSRRESLRLTSAVIVFSLMFGVLIAVVDYGLDKLFKQVLLK